MGILNQYLDNSASKFTINFIHQFHGLDDTNNLSNLNHLPDLDIGIGIRRRRPIEFQPLEQQSGLDLAQAPRFSQVR